MIHALCGGWSWVSVCSFCQLQTQAFMTWSKGHLAAPPLNLFLSVLCLAKLLLWAFFASVAFIDVVETFPFKCLLFLAGYSFSSSDFFLLGYCLPLMLCSFFLDITHFIEPYDSPHFFAISLMFLALLTM